MATKSKTDNAQHTFRAWDASPLVVGALIILVFVFAGGFLSAVALLGLFPAVFWWGWTWALRKQWLDAKREAEIVAKYKSQGEL